MFIEKIYKIFVDRVFWFCYNKLRKSDRDKDKYIPTEEVINGYDSHGNYNIIRRDVK